MNRCIRATCQVSCSLLHIHECARGALIARQAMCSHSRRCPCGDFFFWRMEGIPIDRDAHILCLSSNNLRAFVSRCVRAMQWCARDMCVRASGNMTLRTSPSPSLVMPIHEPPLFCPSVRPSVSHVVAKPGDVRTSMPLIAW